METVPMCLDPGIIVELGNTFMICIGIISLLTAVVILIRNR